MYNAEMKIILDPLKQLNYHPLKVYFMLSSKDYTQYADNLPINVFWCIAVRFETHKAR